MVVGEQLTREEIYRRIDIINGKPYWVSVPHEQDAMESQKKGLYRQLEQMDREKEINSLPTHTYNRRLNFNKS